MDHLSRENIVSQLKAVTEDFNNYCNGLTDEVFFHQPPVKWSIAQNADHLITSANMTRLVYRLPRFFIRWYVGKPNRASRTYDEVVAKYQRKLAEGGKASGRFDTKPVQIAKGKEKLMTSFRRSMAILSDTIEKSWTDQQLDRYLAPHPLLGKLTLREMAYFTIYHIRHHLQIVKDRSTDL